MQKYSWKSVVIVVIVVVIILIIGIFVGIGIGSKYQIAVDNKIRYTELLNWITTIFIGIWVGYILKNQYENNKVVKGYLLDDLKKINEEILTLKDYCYSFKNSHCFDENQRKEIIAKINLIDKKIKVFSDFLKDCNKTKHTEINAKLVNSLNDLNRKITGDNFYEKEIPNSYFDEIVSEGSKFEGELRKITLTVIRVI